MKYKSLAQLRTAEQFLDYCRQIGADLPFDSVMQFGDAAPLACEYLYRERRLGNRFAVLPMERCV